MKRLLTITLFVLFLSITSGNAVIRYVDNEGVGPLACGGNLPCYPTIQAAINASSPNDNVRVFSGTYIEEIVIPLNGLHLGPAPGQTVYVEAPPCSVCTAATVITVMADNVTIRELDVSNSQGTPSAGIALYNSNNCMIMNNNVHNNFIGIAVVENSNNNRIIGNNSNNNTAHGILIDYYVNNESSSQNNIIHQNNTVANGGVGIYLGETAGNTTISNNHISVNQEYGIELYVSDNNTIKGNHIYFNQTTGIRIGGSQNNMITHNIIEGGGAQDNGIVSASTITIPRNSPGNQVHYNTIFDHTGYGLEVEDHEDNFVNATCNWWGDIGGPAHTDNPSGTTANGVSDDVIYNPWLDGIFEEGGKCRLFVFLDDEFYPDILQICANESDDCVVNLDDLDIPGANPDAEYSYSFNPDYLVETTQVNGDVVGTITRAIRGGDYYLVVTDDETGYSGMTDIAACSVEVSEYNVIVAPGSVAHRFKAEQLEECLNLYELALGVYDDEILGSSGYDSENNRYIDAEGNEYFVEIMSRVGWVEPDGFFPQCYVPKPNEQIYLWIILKHAPEGEFFPLECEAAVRRLNVTIRGNEIFIEIT